MKIQFCSDQPTQLPSADLLAIGLFEDGFGEAPLADGLDRVLAGELMRLVKEERFEGKHAQSLLLHTLGQLRPQRILLVGLGKREEFEIPDLRRLGAAAAVEAGKRHLRQLIVAIPAFELAATERAVQFLVEGLHLGSYRFDRYLGKERRQDERIETVSLALAPERGVHPLSVARAEIVAREVLRARDLVNEAPSILTPSRLAEEASAVASQHGLELKLLGPKECEKQKLHLLLAVGRGSSEEPRFIHLCYRPRGREKPRRRFVLVGKGVTFDSGGLSLKPAASMHDMKTDMAGAAAVIGAIAALAELGSKAEIHALCPAVENMPSGSAYKLGDVLVGLGGKSVEIVNTDAEGRLILADALAYAVKLAPDEIIDLATLTGACAVALGPHIAGVMGNERALSERFLAAARRVGEEMWPLPLPERLRDMLKSPVADLKNSGERWGAALTAGLFLREFVGKVPWLHVDIAGPASAEKDHHHIRKGGTGFGVATLVEYVGNRADADP